MPGKRKSFSVTSALGVALVLLFLLSGCRPGTAPNPPDPEPPAEPGAAEKTITLKLHFVFGGKDHVVHREVPATRAVGRAAIQELIKGYLGPDGERGVLPPGTQLKDLTILGGIAYVDFSREFRDNHWGGLASEVDTVYSVVNTLGEFPTVQAVQFLLEGGPLTTIGSGAVDLAKPVKPCRITPDLYAQLAARLAGPAARSLSWNAWVKSEERLGLREGFPEAVLTGDTDGDGAAELIFTGAKRVSIWRRNTGSFSRVWERKFNSAPQVVLAPTRGGNSHDLVVATEEGIFIFGWLDGGYAQLGWQGIPGTLLDLAAGDTTGDGRAEILALFGETGHDPEEVFGGRIVIWEWNGETYLRRREEQFSYRRILLADLTGDGRDEILAFARRGVTVFGWQGAAYVELTSNPVAGSALAVVLTCDVDGDGCADLVVRDDASPTLYVYAWREGGLTKLWQASSAEERVLGREVFAGPPDEGYPTLIAAANTPGSYVVYRNAAGTWQELILSGRGGEQVLAVDDVDGDGAVEIVFRRHQLLSNPVQWLYVGEPGPLPRPEPTQQDGESPGRR